jgi:putative hemolysin
MDIADRIDTLLLERAPWLARKTPTTRLMRAGLDRLLGYRRTLQLGQSLAPLPAGAVLRRSTHLVARNIAVTGLGHIPAHGPALIVANHPTGIADGLVVARLLAARRPDAFFYANADILRVLPQLSEVIAPVEWRPEKRSHAKARATMAYTRAAFGAGRLGVIFPAGRLARREGLTLHERAWMASAAMIARRFDLPVIPLHISARNSALFYAFDLVHPSLRDITLFHETLNKTRTAFRVTVGAPIPAAALPACSEAAIARLRTATLSLAPAPRLWPSGAAGGAPKSSPSRLLAKGSD